MTESLWHNYGLSQCSLNLKKWFAESFALNTVKKNKHFIAVQHTNCVVYAKYAFVKSLTIF